MGMFDSARDQALHLLATSWGEWQGDVEAPIGSFAAIQIGSHDLEGVLEHNRDDIAESGLLNLNELVGCFILRTDGNGLDYVFPVSTPELMMATYEGLDREYGEWLDEAPSFGHDSLGIEHPIAGMVDQFYIDMMAANAAEPYIHADYELAQRQWAAAILLFVKGDRELADAIIEHWYRSGEDLGWYAGRFSRQWMLDNL